MHNDYHNHDNNYSKEESIAIIHTNNVITRNFFLKFSQQFHTSEEMRFMLSKKKTFSTCTYSLCIKLPLLVSCWKIIFSVNTRKLCSLRQILWNALGIIFIMSYAHLTACVLVRKIYLEIFVFMEFLIGVLKLNLILLK